MKNKFKLLTSVMLLLTLGIGQVWGDDYVLSIATTTAWNGQEKDGKSTTFVSGDQTFTIAKGSTAGTAGKIGTNLLKLSKNATYTITLPNGFTANSINFNGYTNDASNNGKIDKVNSSNVNYEFPLNTVASTEASWANHTATISGTTGAITFHVADAQQIGVIITITGTAPACTAPEIAWDEEPEGGAVGGSATASVTTTPASQTVTWKSSNTSVATVDGGAISFIAPGITKISAEFTYSGSDYCEQKASVSKDIAVLIDAITPGTNDKVWYYTTAKPSSSPDNGLNFGSNKETSGLYGVKLNSSGFAWFVKPAVAGKLRVGAHTGSGTSAYEVYVYACDNEGTKSGDALGSLSVASAGGVSSQMDIAADVAGIRIERKTNSEGVLYFIEFEADETTCTTPTNDATFAATSYAIEIAYGDDDASTTLSFTKGDNTSNPTYAVTKGGSETSDATASSGTFTATAAGTYVVTATQAEDGTYCEVEKQVTITVTEGEAPVSDDCPESGVFYSLSVKSATYSVPSQTETNMVSDYATVTGGEAYIGNSHTTDAGKAQVMTTGGGTVYFGGNNGYIKVVLDCDLQTNDVISFVNGSGSNQISFTTAATRATTPATSSNTWTVTSEFATAVNSNSKTFYIWRASGNATYLHSLTIIRPYDVSFVSAKGTAPTTPTKAVTLTLEEITGVDGWAHSGWTADKAVKVGGEDKTAGTALAVDATVTLTDNTTFTAVWEEAIETFTVTFKDGESTLGTQDVASGEKATALSPAPTKAGNSFDYWYKVTGESGQEDVEYDFNTAVTADMTLMAHWTELDNDATLSYLEVDGESVPVPADGIYRMVAAYGHNPQVTAATTASSGASRVIYNIPTHSDQEGGFDYVQVTVTAHDGVTVKYYQIRYTHAPKLGVEIIKATHTGAKTASVTGYIGGSADKNTQDNGKLGSNNHYFGIQLTSGNFQSGDIVAIKASVLNGGNTATLFTDKGTTALASGAFNTVDNMYYYTLEAEVEKIYLYRATSACNPNVEYIAVYRSMNPFIASFKFGDDAATINESAKTITIDVPYGTDVTALTPMVEVNGNGGATYTPTDAQDFTSPVNYVVTDGYDELSTTYAVTVNVATPSENAYLASLSVAGYALNFNKETTSYTIVLDYGTTALPEITYEVEDDLAEALKVEGGVNGATTITVTPQAGAGYEKDYTINFSVNTSPKFVIFDGSTMSDYAESGSDNGTGFAWTVTGGNHSEKSVNTTLNGKTYTKGQNIFGSATKGLDAGNTRYITITIPEGYLAKFYLAGATNSSGNVRSSYISKEITGTLDESIAYVSTDQYAGAFMRSDLQLPGTYYYCADNSIRLYELSVQLYPIDYSRDLTQGMLSTTCLPNGGVVLGASIFEIAYMDYEADGTTPHKIYFDEVVDGVMEAGMPYVVLVDENSTGMSVFYTDNENKGAQSKNGLVGHIGATTALVANDYFIYNNMFYYVSETDAANGRIKITDKRAYINLSEVPGYNHEPISAPAPGRRRMAMGNGNAPKVATGCDNVQDSEISIQKVLIDGQLFILRGEKMYDVTGRLVK